MDACGNRMMRERDLRLQPRSHRQGGHGLDVVSDDDGPFRL
jgi:hypothetical protein